MQRSGCLGLILGLESPSRVTLAEAGKRYVDPATYPQRIRKIREYNISLWGAFIFGFDTDDWRACMETTRFAQRSDLSMSCYPILTPYPGTRIWETYKREGRILSEDWDRYNGTSVVFEPKQMTPMQLRHAQLAAFAEFYSFRSCVRRLGVWPIKKYGWLTNIAIWRGIHYYYHRKGRRIPSFADFLDPDAPAWRHDDGRGRPDTIHDPIYGADAMRVAESDPFRQAACAVAAADAAPSRSSATASRIIG
jgi:radical SAM superfamily enzyme YgiQ (UPF0313 family)